MNDRDIKAFLQVRNTLCECCPRRDSSYLTVTLTHWPIAAQYLFLVKLSAIFSYVVISACEKCMSKVPW